MEKENKQEDFNLIKSGQKIALINKLFKHQLIIELILLSVSVLAYFVIIELLTVSLILFSIFYFFLSFSERKTSPQVNVKVSVFLKYLSGWGKSIIGIGILYALTNWPGATMMMSVGILTVIAVTLTILYYTFKGINDEVISITELFRNAITLAIAIYIYIDHFGTVLFVE